MKEELSSPIQNKLTLTSVAEEKHENLDAAHNQPAEDDDSLDKGILDEGGQLTPIDDLASPEDSYFLGFEYTGEQADKMVLSPPRPLEKEFTFAKPAAGIRPPPQPATSAVMELLAQWVKVKPNYQLLPKGTCLIEPTLTQPHVWVHYNINKLPVQAMTSQSKEVSGLVLVGWQLETTIL